MMLHKIYRIETARLVIRCYEPKDAPLLKQAIDSSLEHLIPWMPWAKNEPQPLEAKVDKVREFKERFDTGQDYTYGIFDKTEQYLIGSTGLHTRIGPNAREIGYWIALEHINHGYATENVQALTKIGFEVEHLERIEIHCAPNNNRSFRVPQKLGYQLEATLQNNKIDSQGLQRDTMIWTLFKADYAASAIKDIPIKAYDAAGNQII